MLAVLRKIAEAVSQQPNLHSALSCFVLSVKEAINTECCSVYFADYSQDDFVLMATEGLNPEAVGKFRIGFTEGLVGLVAQREEPINLAFAQTHPRFMHAPEVKEDNYNAFLAVPIVHQKKVLGVIVVQQKIARVFTQDEESLLVTLSAQLASQLALVELKEILKQDELGHQTSCLKGLSGAPGIAIGHAFVVLPELTFNSFEIRKHTDVTAELTLFRQAVSATRHDFNLMSQELAGSLSEETVAVFHVYQNLLDAKSLGNSVENEIKAGWCAKSALKLVIEKLVSQFMAMQDTYLKERAIDIQDIGLRVLHHMHDRQQAYKSYPENTILVADVLTPTMLADVPKDKIAGVISVSGAANSHASILTRALGIPAIWGVSELPILQVEGKEIILDAYAGRLYVSPSKMLLSEYTQLKKQEGILHDQFASEHHLAAETLDGEHIRLLVNAGLEISADLANANYIDGVGLYRTEAWFMQRSTFPTQNEQELWYRQVLSAYHPSPVVMRTLDIGGDKMLSYFDVKEENPFLGWRGIRVSLDHPELFLDQLKAMLKANAGLGNLKILFPMVTEVSEVAQAKQLLERAYYELADEWADQFYQIEMPEIGVMLEVPSSTWLIPEWAGKVDFCSVGSNDLTQYLLAVDRTNSRVAELFNPFHPAVLRVLNNIAEQCQQFELPFSLCGELAADPEGAILLVAMGYRSLSMNPSSINQVKWALRRLEVRYMEDLLAECLRQPSAILVQRLVRNFIVEHGLSQLLYTCHGMSESI
ncbi:phosphoenolpyruvate--protein phosphotransferase [Pseudoalteromonas tunicata]|uniref:phosphoenolpyruvate--protein phosphotransferase n=1 Tax=Pseudoalteromonas tunicata TaxID=314281 RepID=UPI00273F3003|nr:phosphoenolpyruvate--protein phosphotransferase [Pseudoalteromonas tunicata]MDP5212501.1 phosphoenolpyruvate--protein phosphotransferase [Pseudoalteromonas tunicata]